jgi:hypothetical protein
MGLGGMTPITICLGNQTKARTPAYVRQKFCFWSVHAAPAGRGDSALLVQRKENQEKGRNCDFGKNLCRRAGQPGTRTQKD